MVAALRGTGGNGNGGTGWSSGTGGTGTSGSGTGQPEKPRELQVVPDRSYYRRAIDNLGTTSADSVPIPLLVLASLGGLLLLSAAGLAGTKRYRAIRARPKPSRRLVAERHRPGDARLVGDAAPENAVSVVRQGDRKVPVRPSSSRRDTSSVSTTR